jgi:hypothetical protein
MYLYHRTTPLLERTSALESVLGTLTKEGLDFREKSKQVTSLISTVSTQDATLVNISNTLSAVTKELKEQKKYINYLTGKLTESGISDIKPYRSGGKVKPKAKKSVSFQSDSEEEDEDDSEDDVRDVRKALKAKKK